MSANQTSPPTKRTQFAEAAKVIGVVITLSPLERFKAKTERCNPAWKNSPANHDYDEKLHRNPFVKAICAQYIVAGLASTSKIAFVCLSPPNIFMLSLLCHVVSTLGSRVLFSKDV